MSAVTFPCLRCLVCGDLRSLQETEAAFILSPFSRERIILCKLGKMWKDVGTPADSYYQVRPDCTDVPERKFRIKGVHPSISGEVWEFLLGCYDPSSTFEEREQIRQRRRYELLRWAYVALPQFVAPRSAALSSAFPRRSPPPPGPPPPWWREEEARLRCSNEALKKIWKRKEGLRCTLSYLIRLPILITFMRKKDFRKEQLVLEDLVLEYIV
ncbi:uncharacterized protein LOC131011619 isoform X2 [Salvia miltiorrhiza]|uniref:uncharacterized protein LOC131011619 isoform X2 n=1 Tax=Salvia miltiorrhiza TaxID=226208 RepID=UPI0025ACF825|nr:uncharacterized protein LOC131011619 isoform X2 [Salvia miltiorrhiza]